ncbi:glycosyl transferase family 1 [Mycobacterium antarcticum]|uniref:glycosyltransferase n=1 Tax=unclassified Mycolicibacterium TaxID=2636767 RepID=UPI0023A2F100|nr:MULTISPECIES: glycosyltransferase [unclassified Mycolicibacterium]GLP78211.1 glycosyl transferase family 1 [Mycolicibacterium sp. TUM20983]GLP81262.1 glycosyl transferase family 1 [Mycolicibacterium sp. TUM20984]
MSNRHLRIALLASSRFAVRQPFAGGLEAHVSQLAHALTALGHRVTLFAAEDSATDLPYDVLPVHTFEMTPESRDNPLAPAWTVHEAHAYVSVMLELAGRLRDSFDVVHNHSLHYIPLALARTIPIPMLTTLHTPPLPWMESAVALPGGVASRFVAVSAFTAAQWEPVNGVVPVIANGIDLAAWQPGDGGDYAVWSGRIVPEKGLPAAIFAARGAGFRVRFAGPIGDPGYYEQEIQPLLGPDVHYEGHLRRDELAKLVGGAAVALVTPRWEEPYGLVVAEALACGTPVAAFARGGIPEILDESCGRLARADDIDDLSRAIGEAASLSRADARFRAETHCSQEVMMEKYVAKYREMVAVGRPLQSSDTQDRAPRPLSRPAA